MSDVIKINVSVLKNYNTKFQNEKNSFNTSTYSTFKSSYFFSCSDSTIISMRQKLDNKYNDIQKLYNSIYSFYDNYLKDVSNVENALSENGKTAIESSVYAGLNRLPELKKYNFDFQRFVHNGLNTASFFSPTNGGKEVNMTRNINTSPNSTSASFSEEENPELNKVIQTDASTDVGNMKVESLEDYGNNLSTIDPNKKYTEEEINSLITSYKEKKSAELEEYESLLNTTTKELNDLESLRISFSDLSDQYNNLKVTADGQAIEKISNYKIYCSDEKLKELNLTQQEIQNMEIKELLEICKTKDSDIKALYQVAETVKEKQLDEKVRSMTEFESYKAYEAYISDLKQDKIVLKSAIMKTKNMLKTAEYNFLPLSEDYQQFDSTKVTDTPIENTPNYPEIKKLLEASKENPELTKMYKYIYEKDGLDAATKFLENMEDTLNQIIGSIRAEKFLNHLKTENDPIDAFKNHVKTSLKGAGDGFENFFSGLGAWLSSKDVYSESEYEALYILQGLQDEKYNGLLDSNYEISQSIGNMIPSIALSMIFTPGVGTVSMGISAGGNSYHNALVEGASTSNAILYGTLSGLSEATLEKYLGAIPGLSEVDVTSMKTFAKAMFKEGIEEGTQEYLDAFLQSGLLGENTDLGEVTKNAGKSALYGALVGGIMNTPSLAINNMAKNNTMQGELSSFTLENLENVKNKKFFRLQTEDGKVYTYNEIAENLFETEYQKLLNTSPVPGKSVTEIGDNMVDLTNKRIDMILNGKINAQKFIKGLLLSPVQFLGRFVNVNVSNNNKVTNTILNEGIYHFTDVASAKKIMESGYVKATGNIGSYGKKKSFFFAGMPTYEQVAMNVEPAKKTVAIKIKVDESALPNLYCREFCDNAITKYGDFHFNEGEAEIVYLALKPENNDLKYVEISKDEYDNYDINIPTKSMTSILDIIKYNIVGLSTSYDILMNDIDIIKNKIVGLSDSEALTKIKGMSSANLGIIDPNISWFMNLFGKKKNTNQNELNSGSKVNEVNKESLVNKTNSIDQSAMDEASNIKIPETELENQFQKNANLIDSIKTQGSYFNEITNKVNQLKSKIEENIKKLNSIENKSPKSVGVSEKINDVKKKIKRDIQELNDLIGSMQSQGKQLNDAKVKVEQFASKIQEKFNRIEEIKRLEKQIETDLQEHTKLIDSIKSQKNRLNSIKVKEEQLRNKILETPIETDIQEHAKLIDSIQFEENQLNNSKVKEEDLSNKILEHSNKLEEITKLKDQIDIDAEMEGVTNLVNSIQPQLNDVELKIKQLTSSAEINSNKIVSINDFYKKISRETIADVENGLADPTRNYNWLDKISKIIHEPGKSTYSKLVNGDSTKVRNVPSENMVNNFYNRFNSKDYKVKSQGTAFSHIKDKNFKIQSDKITKRLYINNPDFDSTMKFATLFANKCEEKNIPFYFKTAWMENSSEMKSSSFTRDESMVIYSADEYLAEYVNICNEIKLENKDIKFDKPPILTGVLDGFIGYGHEPKTHNSYNDIRSKIIENAVNKADEWYFNNQNNFSENPDEFYKQYLDQIYYNIKIESPQYGVSGENFIKNTN